MTIYKVLFNLIGLDSTVTDQIRNRRTPNDDDTGRAEQSSSTSRVPDSNMSREPLVDNSAGPSQSTTEEQSHQSGNTGHAEPSGSAIIEISDEESNGPSGSSNAALPAERKRKIGGEMTLYKLRFSLVGTNSTVNDQTGSTINNNDENREDTGRAGQHTSPTSVSRPNVTSASNQNIRKLTDRINSVQCWVTNRPLPNNFNSGQNQRSDSNIIEISDEESNASAAGPSSRASVNAQRPIENTRNDEMTLYSYSLKLKVARENTNFFTDQSTYRLRNRNEESEEETEEIVPPQNVISQEVINKLIDSCDELSQSNIRSETQPANSQGPQSDTNVIEISDDETSSGPSAMAPPNASQTIEKGNSSHEKKIKQEKEDSEQDDDAQA
ncbi:uncharacterized protein LOC125076255 [Vanessa atalanta]|uniref:uncharacterized protein LOC125076255 n=1 Tax=Vanessa atalanta TaxID=42275 RepID=UPI001FCDD209|nr:uncharacterized protein LOC125076255 [Vanessa atalanta]